MADNRVVGGASLVLGLVTGIALSPADAALKVTATQVNQVCFSKSVADGGVLLARVTGVVRESDGKVESSRVTRQTAHWQVNDCDASMMQRAAEILAR